MGVIAPPALMVPALMVPAPMQAKRDFRHLFFFSFFFFSQASALSAVVITM